MTIATTDSDADFPTARKAWYVVGLLVFAYALSMIDRFIPILMVDQLNAEFNLNDAQLGLLIGFGFAFVYAFAGLPLANLIDQGQRRLIVAIGIIIWSMATLGSGFATSYWQLLACRAMLAIGEAVLTPAAVSLIFDLFPATRRALPMSVYAGIASIMGMGSLVVAGGAMALAAMLSPMLDMAPWRVTFLLLGAPGILLGILFLTTVTEPLRQSRAVAPAASAAQFFAYLRDRWTFFIPLFAGVALTSIVSFAQVTWVPNMLVRSYGFPAASAGITFGLIVGAAAIIGVFVWPQVAQRLRNGLVRCLLIGSASGGIAMMIGMLGESAGALLVPATVASFLVATLGVLTPLAIQRYGDARMQARLTAVYLFLTNMLGQGLGPLSVPLMVGVLGTGAMLESGLLVTAAIVIPLAVSCYWLSLLSIRRGTVEPG
ncbi:MFS transporter [Sphingomonas colocasiae]|uniref:MFS transporter n=1 Tax=Sphingomonas colocasiae TaxID=1848973 RepID=A0ABS7PU93_9SPHN|nr:MFS transporter [Sphingomonas colocasiae]MBY8824920.1 MFS transporter [Sphingomonas colocasiae]